MTKTIIIAIVTHAILLGLLLVWLCFRPTTFGQTYHPLGELSCKDDKQAIWVRVIARFDGFKTEKRISVWVCEEDYEEMTRE